MLDCPAPVFAHTIRILHARQAHADQRAATHEADTTRALYDALPTVTL